MLLYLSWEIFHVLSKSYYSRIIYVFRCGSSDAPGSSTSPSIATQISPSMKSFNGKIGITQDISAFSMANSSTGISHHKGIALKNLRSFMHPNLTLCLKRIRVGLRLKMVLTNRTLTTFIMADILNVLLCASKLAFLASLWRKDYFEMQAHKRGEKVLLAYT